MVLQRSVWSREDVEGELKRRLLVGRNPNELPPEPFRSSRRRQLLQSMQYLRYQRGRKTTTSMADAERRAGQTAPADRAPPRACPRCWSPSADYFAAAGFFTSLALRFPAARFGSFRSTVFRSSW